MKKITLILMLLSFKSLLFSQSDSVYNVPEQLATFPGGKSKMIKFLRSNIKYPEKANQIEISRPSYIRYIIEKDGSISNITVLSGIPNCTECDNEAMNVIKKMPQWKPAKQDGQIVRSAWVMPIRFN